MNINYLAPLYDKHLEQLYNEISAYYNEADLWLIKGEISNSAGTLCLHLIGNLNHFIGAKLGNSGYIRDRDAEFSDRDVPREKLLQEITSIRKLVKETLAGLPAEAEDNAFPGEGFFADKTVGFVLLYLTSHLAYHLGQINYHRRLIAAG